MDRYCSLIVLTGLAMGIGLLYYSPEFQDALVTQKKGELVRAWLCQCY